MSAEAATAATPVKTKKVAKKPATKPEHPTYKEMVAAAVAALKERKGSSRQAIVKYIKGNYKVNDSCDLFVKSTLVFGHSAYHSLYIIIKMEDNNVVLRLVIIFGRVQQVACQ